MAKQSSYFSFTLIMWRLNSPISFFNNTFETRLTHWTQLTMASILNPPPPPYFHLTSLPTSVSSSPVILSYPFLKTTSLQVRFKALRTWSDGGKIGSQEAYGADFLRKPSTVPKKDSDGILEEEEGSEGKRNRGEWTAWEDRILEDTVPLVGFVRMIIHSGK